MGNHNLIDSGRGLSTSHRAGVQWVCGTYLSLCLINRKVMMLGTKEIVPASDGLLPKGPTIWVDPDYLGRLGDTKQAR